MLLKSYLTTLLLLIFSVSSYADQYQGRVIKVIDGDTVWVKSSNKHIKIRLSYIDAPELKQTYGIRSKNFLIEMVLDKEVQINTNKKDRYNRHLGELYIHNSEESIFVNAKMIKSDERNNVVISNGSFETNDAIGPRKCQVLAVVTPIKHDIPWRKKMIPNFYEGYYDFNNGMVRFSDLKCAMPKENITKQWDEVKQNRIWYD